MSTNHWIKLISSAAVPTAALIFGVFQYTSTIEIGRQQSERDLRMKFVDFTWSAIKDGDTVTVEKALRVLSSVDRNAAIELAGVVLPPKAVELRSNNPMVTLVAMQGMKTIPIKFIKHVPLTDWESRSYQAVRKELLRLFPNILIDEKRIWKVDRKHERVEVSCYLSYGPGEEEFANALKSVVDSVVPGLNWSKLDARTDVSGLHLLLNNPEQ